MCLTLGATSTVETEESTRQKIAVTLNGKPSPAPVTKTALRLILGKRKIAVRVDTVHDLPLHQGFGMSAAGALSASLALTSILNMNRQRAFEAAHIAEIRNKGGLGDVSALYKGGITIRVKPGLPPLGKVINIKGVPTVVLAVLGKGLLTRSVLSDPPKRYMINKSGGMMVDRLLKERTIAKFMELSYEFSVSSGLTTKRIVQASSAASKLGAATMAMLGTSVFAVGDARGLVRVLSEFGETWVCKVDMKGPRLIRKA